MDVILARFEGGPADGYDLGLAGGMPSYLLLMPSPPGVSMPWIIVGAGFDDHWPDQVRYEKAAFGLSPNADDEWALSTVVYRYAGGP